MQDLKITFDSNGFQEYFIKWNYIEYSGNLLKSYRKETKNKDKKFYIFEKSIPTPVDTGSFLLDFLNLDFANKEDVRKFIFEYLYVNLLFTINKDIFKESEIYCDNTLITDISNYHFELILSEDEIDYYFEKIYAKHINSMMEYQKEFRAIADVKYFDYLYSDIINIKHKTKEEKMKYEAYKTEKENETYFTSIASLGSVAFNLRINFDLRNFYTDKNKKYIINNIPYAFESNKYFDILFISFKQLISTKKNVKVQACANCGKYFIPQTAHDTKYCNSLFDGKRTCKQIGAEKEYNEKLEKDSVLKTYRSRYQALAKQASTSTKSNKSAKMYAKYKKEGPTLLKKYKTGELTKKEFEKWIDGMRLK